MNFNLNPETKESVKAFILSGIVLITFYVLLTHLNIVGSVFTQVISAFAPFIFGIFFSFILLPLRNICETRWLKNVKIKKKAKRFISAAFAMIFIILVLILFFILLIPQLISSITVFVGNISGYIQNLEKLIEQLSGSNTEAADMLTSAVENLGGYLTSWLSGATGGLAKIVEYITSFVSVITDFLIGLIISMYILLDTERIKRGYKQVFYSVFPVKVADGMVYVNKLATGMFDKFIFGKAIDSLIIGVICYICVRIMNLPYSVLIAVVIGITNMIPVFGPFIGAIPCLLILVMINWVQALEFLIFIIILQQIDGNIIGPYILGDAVGLPTLLVMFAIIIGGSLFGIVGMFIGVPAFAVVYTLFNDWSDRRLKEKDIEFPDYE